VDNVNEPHHHALVQAPIEPVDEDGVAAAVVGTMVSLLATGVTAWQNSWLASRGQGWWLWVAMTATCLGVMFIAYALYRKRRRLAPVAAVPAETLDGVTDLTADPSAQESVEQ
jgi:uncharacterized membrane protein (UPF0136 family)